MSLLNIKPTPAQPPLVVTPPAPRAASSQVLAAGAVGVVLLALVAGAAIYGRGGPTGAKITATGEGVLIVHESDEDGKLTSTQLDAMKSTADDSLRGYVKSKEGAIFRLLDKDDDVAQDLPVIQEVWKTKRDALPWLYVWKNRSLVGKPLTTEADAITTAKSKLR